MNEGINNKDHIVLNVEFKVSRSDVGRTGH